MSDKFLKGYYIKMKQYTVQDIEALFEANIDAAGLFLAPVFAGMQGLGHLLYGVSGKDAFLKFAQYRMRIKKMHATILWDNMRGGLFKHWMSTTRILTWGRYDPDRKDEILYPSTAAGVLIVDARRLARLYVDTVRKLPDYDQATITGTWADGCTDAEIDAMRNDIENAIKVYQKQKA